MQSPPLHRFRRACSIFSATEEAAAATSWPTSLPPTPPLAIRKLPHAAPAGSTSARALRNSAKCGAPPLHTPSVHFRAPRQAGPSSPNRPRPPVTSHHLHQSSGLTRRPPVQTFPPPKAPVAGRGSPSRTDNPTDASFLRAARLRVPLTNASRVPSSTAPPGPALLKPTGHEHATRKDPTTDHPRHPSPTPSEAPNQTRTPRASAPSSGRDSTRLPRSFTRPATTDSRVHSSQPASCTRPSPPASPFHTAPLRLEPARVTHMPRHELRNARAPAGPASTTSIISTRSFHRERHHCIAIFSQSRASHPSTSIANPAPKSAPLLSAGSPSSTRRTPAHGPAVLQLARILARRYTSSPPPTRAGPTPSPPRTRPTNDPSIQTCQAAPNLRALANRPATPQTSPPLLSEFHTRAQPSPASMSSHSLSRHFHSALSRSNPHVHLSASTGAHPRVPTNRVRENEIKKSL